MEKENTSFELQNNNNNNNNNNNSRKGEERAERVQERF